MNISVHSLAGAPAPAPIPVPLDDTDEAIIRLIKAYWDGIAAYNAGAGDDFSNEQCAEFAAETYERPLNELREAPPAILTAAGAIAATRFMRDEIRDFKDTEDLLPLIGRLLDFLESASGMVLVHPDSELLRLGAEWQRLQAAIAVRDAELKKTDAEEKAFRADRTNLRFTPEDRTLFGYGIADEGLVTIDPWKVAQIKPFNLDIVVDGCLPQAVRHNKRCGEIQEAAAEYKTRLQSFMVESGRRALLDASEALYEKRFDVQEKIADIPAKTVSGLVVKARIVRDQLSPWWNRSAEELEYDEEFTRSFVDNILSLAGGVQ